MEVHESLDVLFAFWGENYNSYTVSVKLCEKDKCKHFNEKTIKEMLRIGRELRIFPNLWEAYWV